MDIVVIELPNLQDLTGQIQALAGGIAARQDITADERADVRTLAVSMRARLDAMVGRAGDGVWLGTFHALAAREQGVPLDDDGVGSDLGAGRSPEPWLALGSR